MALHTKGGRGRAAGFVASKKRLKKALAISSAAQETLLHISGHDVTILTADEVATLEKMREEQRRITSSQKNSIDFLKSIGVITEANEFSDKFSFAA